MYSTFGSHGESWDDLKNSQWKIHSICHFNPKFEGVSSASSFANTTTTDLKPFTTFRFLQLLEKMKQTRENEQQKLKNGATGSKGGGKAKTKSAGASGVGQ